MTGSVDFQYLVGIVELQIEIRSGNGTIEFGLGHQNASIELHALVNIQRIDISIRCAAYKLFSLPHLFTPV